MFYKIKDQLRRKIFSGNVRFLLNTAPVVLGEPSAPAVLSQLQHKDVLMYLAAIKSFANRVPVGSVHVIDEGSLTENDRRLLGDHVPGIRFLALADCRDKRLPTGGTWGRLIAIARLSELGYVIQLDADTLSLERLDEVVSACRNDRSFTIGTWNGQTLETVSECANRARRALSRIKSHVQMEAEAHFDQLTGSDSIRYVRGCSGFAGFARGPNKLDFMCELSSQLQSLLSPVWNTWGSEQVMSSLVVANQPNAFDFPHPEYTDCEKCSQARHVLYISSVLAVFTVAITRK